MRVKFALLGDYAIIASDKKISVMGLFDAINAPVLPFQIPAMFLVVGFEGESTEVDHDFALETQLWAEDGERVFEHSKTFKFPPPNRAGGKSGHNEILSLYGFPIKAAGDYAFVIMVDGREEARVPLRVNEPPAGASGVGQ